MEHADGRICWCWLELGEAALMLQEFWPGQTPKETWEMESTLDSSAKTHWPSIASSNHAESRQGDVHLLGTVCGLCQ